MVRHFVPLELTGPIKEGVLLRREKKFIGTAKLGRRTIKAFVPHTGRLDCVLEPQTRVLLVERRTAERKLKYDLIAAKVNGHWVVVDTRLANELIATNLAAKKLEHMGDYATYEREKAIEGLRFDFLLHNERMHVLEVKSCTRVVEGAATFPDTVSTRSTRQIETMISLVTRGYRSSVLFVIMRPDVQRFRPCRDRDPVFAETLRRAWRNGVDVSAVSTILEPPTFMILNEIPVEIR
jgi:sugar fermentation stimulation protein A